MNETFTLINIGSKHKDILTAEEVTVIVVVMNKVITEEKNNDMIATDTYWELNESDTNMKTGVTKQESTQQMKD